MSDPNEVTPNTSEMPADLPTADALDEVTAEAPVTTKAAPITAAELDAPPRPEGLDDFRRKKYSIEFDERTLIWAIVGVLSLLVIVEGALIVGLRGRVKDLESGTTVLTGQPADAVQTTGGAMSWGEGGAETSGWGETGTTGTTGGSWGSEGTGETGTGTGTGTGTTTGGWGTEGTGETSSGWGSPSGEGAAGAGGPPAETVGAMGSGTLPDGAEALLQGSEVMKRLEVFITAQGVDSVAADSLRNVVGESQAILIDIDRKVAAGEKSQAEAEHLIAMEKGRVKAAVETLLGLEAAAALELQVVQGG